MKNKRGFVLAYTVIIMGIAFVVMAILISVVAMQKGVDKNTINVFEKNMFLQQQEYNFENLELQDYIDYLNNNSQSKEVNEEFNIFFMPDYVVGLKKDYTQMIVYNVDKSKILLQKTR